MQVQTNTGLAIDSDQQHDLTAGDCDVGCFCNFKGKVHKGRLIPTMFKEHEVTY